ncbi:MAG: hypothetical protein EOP83_28100, partial [Verrucomicrobiaceae bacterium]
MYSRFALLALAALTPPLSAQVVVQAGVVIGNAAGETVVVEAPEGMPPGVVMPPGAVQGGGPGGELDFNKLRELIEQSKNRPAPTVDQQKAGVLGELQFDRSPAGIMATRMEEARASAAKENPAPPVPPVAPVAPPAPPVSGEAGATPATPAAPGAPPAPPPPSPEALKAQQELEKFRQDAAVFRRDVVLGRWDKVKDFFSALPKEAAGEAYQNIVAKLSAPSQVQPPPELVVRGSKPHTQPAYLSPDDLLGLAAASPVPPQKKQIQGLAKLLPKEPRPPKEFFEKIGKGIQHFGGEDAASRQRAAELL